MSEPWRFDADNPFEETFEESLLSEVASPGVFDMIRRKLLAIQKDPKANHRIVVRGRVVYVSRTGRVRVSDAEIPSLLIVYSLDEREKLIQRLFVCRASALDSRAAELDDISTSPDRETARTEREAPYPIEHTTIPEETLRRAVERALQRSRRQ